MNTYGGVRSIDPVQFDTARTLGLTTLQTLREVVLPAASPQILTGMRISLAISLILAILSEMIVSNDGLGYFTLLAERTFKVPEMYAGIFTLALFGYVLNRLFLMGEARLIRWHQESSGRNRSKGEPPCCECCKQSAQYRLRCSPYGLPRRS